jgi:hypothetical protein
MGEGEGPAEACSNYRETKRISRSSSSNGSGSKGEMGEGQSEGEAESGLDGERYMKVLITLNKTNTGRIQLACVRSTNERGGIGTGYALPPFNPNAGAEIEAILRNLGVEEDLIQNNMAPLSQVGGGELVKVADLDVADEMLRENGFEV